VNSTVRPQGQAFFTSPLFWGVLALKLALGATAGSYYPRDLFVPFLNYFVESGFENPWAHFAALGRLNSFPYPPVMLYALAGPRLALGWLLPAGTDTVTGLHFLALRLPLLAADAGLALILLRWFPHRARRVLLFYWCSPFVIYITYWHGQLDLIPTALFVLALALLRGRRPVLALAVYGLALAAKSHLWVALPFVLVYVHQQHGWRRLLEAAGAALAVYALAVLPYLPDPAFRQMVYGTPEQTRLFAFQLPVGPSSPTGGQWLAVLLAPGAIVILWFRFVGYARRNWDLFMLFLGILFCVFILLAPPAQGYFLWSLPFLVHFIARRPRGDALPYAAYALAYLAFFWLGDQSDLRDAWRVPAPGWAAGPTPYEWLRDRDPARAELAQNALFTLMQAALAGIVLNMYLLGVRSNAVYRMRTTPVLIGLAGDSGAGKSTLARLLQDLFGERRVTVINGDDYHRWPRGHEKWQVYTHLNPRGSRVHEQLEHAVAMHAGRSIVKGEYDHASGQFANPREVDPSEYIIFAGLHALSLDAMRGLFDLKVFLDPDEALRRAWKVQRDQAERGHAPEQVQRQFAQRRPDRQAYILPQRELADVVLRLRQTEAAGDEAGLWLEVLARNGFDLNGLAEALSSAPGVQADLDPFVDGQWQRLRLAGKASAERLASVAAAEVPNLGEMVARPRLAAGVNGMMQLVVVVCLAQRLRWAGAETRRE
jgi:uridine kinase